MAGSLSDVWSRKGNATMNEKPTTRTATDAYVQHHAQILATLEEIRAMVEDLPAPAFEAFEPNWGHVGDLATYASRLTEIRNAIAGGEV